MVWKSAQYIGWALSAIMLFGCNKGLDNKLDTILLYPGGNKKALVMSYDDGPIEDVVFARLLDQHGIVGTFNLNSAYLGTTQAWPTPDGDSTYQQYLPIDSLSSVYHNHEIAAHGSYHKDFFELTDAEILEEVRSDMTRLTLLTQRKIYSMAYPFGNCNRPIANLIRETGLSNARTIDDTHDFRLPDDLFLWDPTCHDSQVMDLVDQYLELEDSSLTLFYVWGHSWEFRDEERWRQIQDFCQTIGGKDYVWYTGAGEYAAYYKALKKIRRAGNLIISPPGNEDVWYQKRDTVSIIRGGESVSVD